MPVFQGYLVNLFCCHRVFLFTVFSLHFPLLIFVSWWFWGLFPDFVCSLCGAFFGLLDFWSEVPLFPHDQQVRGCCYPPRPAPDWAKLKKWMVCSVSCVVRLLRLIIAGISSWSRWLASGIEFSHRLRVLGFSSPRFFEEDGLKIPMPRGNCSPVSPVWGEFALLRWFVFQFYR